MLVTKSTPMLFISVSLSSLNESLLSLLYFSTYLSSLLLYNLRTKSNHASFCFLFTRGINAVKTIFLFDQSYILQICELCNGLFQVNDFSLTSAGWKRVSGYGSTLNWLSKLIGIFDVFMDCIEDGIICILR